MLFRSNPRADLLQNGLVRSPCSPRDSEESSPTPQSKSINSSVLRDYISYIILISGKLNDFRIAFSSCWRFLSCLGRVNWAGHRQVMYIYNGQYGYKMYRSGIP